jgi:hypothetical protein
VVHMDQEDQRYQKESAIKMIKIKKDRLEVWKVDYFLK